MFQRLRGKGLAEVIYCALLFGGMVGGILRYIIEFFIPNPLFPFSTLVINLLGALVLGLFYGIADVRHVKLWLRVGFGTGVIGAFTTFSTFCFDLTHVSVTASLVYASLSILGGPLFAYLANRLVVLSWRRVLRDQGELSA